MWTARAYEPGDRAALAHFRCNGPPYFAFTKRVQTLVRSSLPDAMVDRASTLRATVAVLDGSGEISGVVAYEPSQNDPLVWHLPVLGVRYELQGRGIGRGLFGHALERCRAQGAQSATFEIHRRNDRMIRLAEGCFNAVLSDHPETSEYYLGSILLVADPDIATTAPMSDASDPE